MVSLLPTKFHEILFSSFREESLEHRLSNFLEWGALPCQYGIVPVTLALALLINFVFVFHGLKTVFFLFIELNFTETNISPCLTPFKHGKIFETESL
jgi:hypothetical protein